MALAELVSNSDFARSTVIIHLERLGSRRTRFEREKAQQKAVEDLNSSITHQKLPILRWLLSRASLCRSFQSSKELADTRKADTVNPQGKLVRRKTTL